jgi:hypothetical protein
MKNVFQPIKEEALVKWGGLNDHPTPVSTGNKIEIVYCLKNHFYSSLKDTITTSTINTITPSKKYFFLPACPVSQSRIKELCKKSNVVLVNDVFSADVIVSNDNTFVNVRYSPEDIKTHHIGYESVAEAISNVDGYSRVISKRRSWRDDTVTFDYDSNCFATGLMINTAYAISELQKDVISIETFIKISEKSVLSALDEATLDTLNQMVRSYNDDDKKLAAILLTNIDTSSNLHLIWKLCKKAGLHSLLYLDNKNKDYKAWVESSNIKEFGEYKAEEMIKYMIKKDALELDSFEVLEKEARKEISIYHRSMYVFDVKLSPEWVEVKNKLKTTVNVTN